MARFALALIATLSCSACGLKGDLYLPERTSSAVVVTSSSSSSSASSSNQATP